VVDQPLPTAEPLQPIMEGAAELPIVDLIADRQTQAYESNYGPGLLSFTLS
jgi:hypothetical protein